MVSRIILTTADFSANNIGRVVEVSDFTKKVLAKQTQYSEDSNEAVALNTFLDSLIEGGFIGGSSPMITGLFIPALAKSHDELLYNIAALDESGYPTNGMADSELAAESKVLKLYKDSNERVIGMYASGEDGVADLNAYERQATLNTKLFEDSVGESLPSFSFVAYIPVVNSSNELAYLQTKGTNYNALLSNSVVKVDQNGLATNRASCDVSGTLKGFFGFSYVKDTEIECVSDYAEVSESTKNGSTSSFVVQTGFSKVRLGKYGIYSSSRTHFSLIIASKYIEPTKMVQLQGYVGALMNSLHVSLV